MHLCSGILVYANGLGSFDRALVVAKITFAVRWCMQVAQANIHSHFNFFTVFKKDGPPSLVINQKIQPVRNDRRDRKKSC